MLQFCITLKRVSGVISRGKQKLLLKQSQFSVCQRSRRIWCYVLCRFHCIRSARLHFIRHRKWKFSNVSRFVVHIAAYDFGRFRLFGYRTGESSAGTDLFHYLHFHHVFRFAGKLCDFRFQSIGKSFESTLCFQNMFLAIINDTYAEVKSENVTSDIHIGSYIKATWNQMIECLAKFLPCLRKIKAKIRVKCSESDDELCTSNQDTNNV